MSTKRRMQQLAGLLTESEIEQEGVKFNFKDPSKPENWYAPKNKKGSAGKLEPSRIDIGTDTKDGEQLNMKFNAAYKPNGPL